MPRRVTMHLRSSRRSLAFLLLILVGTALAGQNSQAPGDAFPPQVAASSNPASPKQDAPKPDPPGPEASAPSEHPSQPSPQEDNGGFTFHTRVDEVLLHATVVDDKQRMVTNLDKGAFTILEDGRPQ